MSFAAFKHIQEKWWLTSNSCDSCTMTWMFPGSVPSTIKPLSLRSDLQYWQKYLNIFGVTDGPWEENYVYFDLIFWQIIYQLPNSFSFAVYCTNHLFHLTSGDKISVVIFPKEKARQVKEGYFFSCVMCPLWVNSENFAHTKPNPVSHLQSDIF